MNELRDYDSKPVTPGEVAREAVFDALAREYDQGETGWKWAAHSRSFETRAEEVALMAGIDSGEDVLDLGAGAGFFQRACSQRFAYPRSLDKLSTEFLEKLRYLNGATVDKFYLCPTTVTRISRTPFKWDVIVAAWITFGDDWTLDEWEYVIRELADNLRRGGRMILRFNEDREDLNVGNLRPRLRKFGFERFDEYAFILTRANLNLRSTARGGEARENDGD